MATKSQQRRNKGEGSIKELPNGKYKVTITLGVGIDGKQKRKSITCGTKREAVEKLNELKTQFKNPEAFLTNDKPITFKEFIDKWLVRKKVSVASGTYISYETLAEKHFKPAFNDMLMSRITADHVSDFFMSKLNELSISTVHKLRKVLTTIFMEAIDLEIIKTNPLKKSLKLPKYTRKVDLVLPSDEQIKDMLRIAKERQGTKGYYRRIYPLVLLAVATGMRRGELAGVKWDNINFKTNKIEINSQVTREGGNMDLKTKASRRTISVNPKVLEVINKLERDSPYVFSSQHGGYMNVLSVDHMLSRLFKVAELPSSFTMHDLRHYHATTLIKRGINVKVVSKRLGHSSINITLELYVHYLPSMDEEAGNIIDDSYVV